MMIIRIYVATLFLKAIVVSKKMDHFDVEEHPNWRLLPHDTCRTPPKIAPEVYNGSTYQPYYGESPWVALVYSTIKGLMKKKYTCVGYVINDRYIISTAYCCEAISPDNSLVRVGVYDIYDSGPECGPFGCESPVTYKVEEVVPFHTNYAIYLQNDICLIRLRKRINFTVFVSPICLPLKREIADSVHVGDELQFVGWTSPPNTSSLTSLFKVNLTVVTGHTNCAVESKDICVVEKKENVFLRKRTCESNIGNVLTKSLTSGHHNVTYAFGHLSGVPLLKELLCERGEPVAFTRLSTYTKWILDNIRP